MMHRPYLYLSSAEAQLSLGFGDDKPSESLFFALRPPPPVAAQAVELAQALLGRQGRQGRPATAERLHVTLHYLGDYPGIPPSLLLRAGEAAAQLAVSPFDLRLDRVGSFAGHRDRRPCVLTGEGAGIAGILALHAALGQALLRQGLRPNSNFTPHMTLFYGEAVPSTAVEPLAWQVGEIALIRSFLGQGRYQEEGRWRLR